MIKIMKMLISSRPAMQFKLMLFSALIASCSLISCEQEGLRTSKGGGNNSILSSSEIQSIGIKQYHRQIRE
jgi:hypothetical protein